jgi:hypothetical protein
MNNAIIICPYCNREIPLTEAILNQMRQQVQKEFHAQHSQQEKLLADLQKQIEQVVNNTALMYGDLQGIVGQAALPTIKVLELEG